MGVDAALVVVWRVRVVCRRAGVLVRVSVACGVQALCAALRVRLPSFDGVFGRRDRMCLLMVVCGVVSPESTTCRPSRAVRVCVGACGIRARVTRWMSGRRTAVSAVRVCGAKKLSYVKLSPPHYQEILYMEGSYGISPAFILALPARSGRCPGWLDHFARRAAFSKKTPFPRVHLLKFPRPPSQIFSNRII